VAWFQRGATFLGRYVLLGPVGRGGVSVVYEALDTVGNRHVAIKMLDPTHEHDTRAQERIRREAVITDRMRHPSVPRVYGYGDVDLGNGTSIAYVVMELLVGTGLTEYLAKGRLPWLDAVQVAATIADVLAVAHKRGVVHRDLTPANIMITERGARIIDFGVAVTVETPGDGPYVLAPGRLLPNDFAGPGEPADDVHALGVLLYQMVTGAPPFVNQPPPTVTAALRLEAPVPAIAVPDVPRGLVEICRRCVAKHPSDRPDAATVALDLWALIVPQYERAGYERAGYERAGYERAGYERAGYERAGYEQAGYEQAGYDRTPYEHAPYDWPARQAAPADRSPREWPTHERTPPESTMDAQNPGWAVDQPLDRATSSAGARRGGEVAWHRRTRPFWTARSSAHRSVDRANRPTHRAGWTSPRQVRGFEDTGDM
jgi:hypothetical protein